MTKKKKVKKKVKKIDHIKNNSKFIQDILDKPLEDYSKNAEYTFTDKLKDYGRNALIIMFVAFFFSGGWFPFGLYDKYTISKDEANFEWSNALKPIITWCQQATDNGRNSVASFSEYELRKEPGFTSEHYAKLNIEEIKCLSDKNYRIFLINNDPSIINQNKLIKNYFELLPEDIKNLKITSSKSLNELRDVEFTTNSNDWGYGWDRTFEEFISMKKYDDEWDNSQWFCLENSMWCGKKYGDKKGQFKLGFLSEKEFWLITMACQNGCIGDLKFYEENGINYLKEYNIKSNILTELFDYNNKEDDYVKKYEKMILEIKEKINILNQKSNTNIKYSTPPWSLNIKL